MDDVETHLSDDHAAFVAEQRMFFVATAPGTGGHVNLSPKGQDTFRVLGPTRVAYLDLTGSGNETSAHLQDNGRITFMFCAFEGPPKILRLYGKGRTVLRGCAEWDTLAPRFDPHPGIRQIIVVELERIQKSCGYAVPRYDFVEERDVLAKWTEKKGKSGLEKYWRDKNVRSIDGLPTPLAASVGAAEGDTDRAEH